jgi:hypothetical protein
LARSHATIYGTAWATDSEFRTLPSDVQLLYIALLAQPDLNLCGVMPFIPARWVRFAPDFGEKIDTLVATLELHGYVVTDQETVELWVRSFMFHDRVLAQPQVAMAAARAFDAVQSPTLRHLIVQSLPPELRHRWPDCLKGVTRTQAKVLLDGCDAPSWKPSVSPNASPNARGSARVREALAEASGNGTPNGSLPEGSGSGSGLGSRFQVPEGEGGTTTSRPSASVTRGSGAA